MRIQDTGWKQFGSGMKKSRIRDKHPGSAKLLSLRPNWVPLRPLSRKRVPSLGTKGGGGATLPCG